MLNKLPMGHYPVALIPGQFVDYYKSFTPEQMTYLPLNSATAGPAQAGTRLQDIKSNNKVDSDGESESDSESDSSSGSSGSSSDSDESSSSSSEEEEEEQEDKKLYVRELKRPIGKAVA